jgi:hypothetical protein
MSNEGDEEPPGKAIGREVAPHARAPLVGDERIRQRLLEQRGTLKWSKAPIQALYSIGVRWTICSYDRLFFCCVGFFPKLRPMKSSGLSASSCRPNSPDEQITSTLVDEMTHLWQHHCSTPPSRGYHNKEWANKMKEVGLQPSSTGMVGGKETGQSMSHYIIPRGPYATSFAKLAAPDGHSICNRAARPGSQTQVRRKSKFTCPDCGQNAWGKPELAIDCRHCESKMLSPDRTNENRCAMDRSSRVEVRMA